ncbi:MAG: NAD(P)/FAD-dependent oxidoreductase [Spirochaetales bacterium]|nr:NAD(P)/FAD-dependent oxidoreductase [Spirochaetales bacterium]
MKYDTFDLIVIGAGSGGCTVAREAAKGGISVVMIDKRKEDEIGGTSTYDMIPSYVFDKLGLPVPLPEETGVVLKTLRVFSPSRRYSFETNFGAYLVHRTKFGQRLLGYALESGATLHAETEFVEPVIEDGFLVGVICRTAENKLNEYRGKLVCDASGYPGVVRITLPESVYRNEELREEDIVRKYREVRDILSSSDTIPADDYPGCYCYLCNRGYSWIIPEGNHRADIGCSIPFGPDHQDPKKIIKDFCKHYPKQFGNEIYAPVMRSISSLPIRTSQPELVGNGFLIVGDAACQASPISAFGMAGSMIAGKLAAESAAIAILKKDLSRQGLWEYPVRYSRGLGSCQAFVDPMRIFLQNTPDKDMEFIIKRGLLGTEEFSLIWTDEPFAYSFLDKITKFFKCLPYLSLVLKLQFVYTIGKKMEKHYKHFPFESQNFNAWLSKRKALYINLFKKLKVKRSI